MGFSDRRDSRRDEMDIELFGTDESDEQIVGDEAIEGLNVQYHDELHQAHAIKGAMAHADDLSQAAAIRQHEWKRLRDVAPFMRNNPPSALGIQYGTQVQLVSGQRKQVAAWKGADVESTDVTVTLGLVQPLYQTMAFPPVSYKPYGIVNFGTSGFALEAEIDIGNGCQFTVGASAVYVQVAMEPAGPITGIDSIPGTMLLTGMLSFNPIVRTTQLTRTKYVGDNPPLPPGTSDKILVPAFAKNVVFVGPSAQTIDLIFLDANGFGLYEVNLLPATLPTAPIPLSGDVVAVQVRNAALAGPDAFGRLVFGLCL